ncbi:MAG: hypothetical protein RL338_1300 [Chloroflexota bacterium]
MVRLRIGAPHGAPIFRKAIRDAVPAIVVMTGLIGLMVVAGAQVMSTTYGSPATRAGLAAMAASIPPVLRGFYGDPVNVDTIGGFVTWHYGAVCVLLGGLWSLLALSGTLAGEARRGSLELVLAAPVGRRRVAVEKLLGHLVALSLALVLVACLASTAATLRALTPRDEIAPAAALAFAAGLGARSLVVGSLAFALAPLLGRGAAAGIAGATLVGGYLVHGYREIVPLFATLDPLLPLSWAAGHRPLAGASDWPAVGATLAAAALLLALGVELFARRDVGVTVALPGPALPSALRGLRGPLGRALGELLPTIAAWGLGLGLYGLVMALVSGAMLDLLAGSPALAAVWSAALPGTDITTAPGFLQIAFVDFGALLLGAAVTALVANRWGDESGGRLELLLATPLSRGRWLAAAVVGGWVATGLVAAFLAGGLAAGLAAIGEEPVRPAIGVVVLACYGFGLVGLGAAVGATFGPGAAAVAVGAVAVGSFLVDTLAPFLGLPDWVPELALTTHLGEPLVGRPDPLGIVASLALGIGGLLIGLVAIRRRDLGG